MKRRGVWITVAAVLVVLVAGGIFAFLQAKQFESLARAGRADASAGLKSLQAKDNATALASFTKAQDEFGRARDLLGPEWLHGFPWLGRQLAAADDLATIGREGSAAGAQAAELLNGAASVTGDDRLSQLLRLARPHLDSALASLVVVAQRSDGLTTDGLLPQLADAVTQLRSVIDPLQPVLDRSQSLLDLERYLFSRQHQFLVVAQNSSELRPTGGFMGTFGLLQFGPDGFVLDKFADVYTLPKDTLNEPLPAGGQVNYKHFYFRNTNWWMDFPTSATMMLKFWQNLRQPQVDGVVAVDIPLLEDLLTVYGPITVPQSSTPITAKNAMEVLNTVVQYELSGQSDRKGRKLAIVSLVDELFQRVGNLPADKVQPTLDALAKAANEKHVQIFLSDPTAQAAMVGTGWSGAIAPPQGTTDLVAVSNGVIKPSKANFGVSKSLAYTVDLKSDGSADTTLELGYRKSSQRQPGLPQQWLADYVRVHRLPGTRLASGGSTFESLDDATGLPTFGHYFRLDLGASTTVMLKASVPDAAPADAATADTRHYRLLLVKQADLSDTQATVTVRLPDGWKAANSAASFRTTGTTVPVSAAGDTVTVTTPLKQDLILDLTLAPA